MEDSEVVDDQNSGWFQVKKKHRNVSKFSLQSWVGGLSGKNDSNPHRTQHSHNKHKTHLSRSGEIFLPKPVPGSVTRSLSASNEEESTGDFNTGVVRHNSQTQKSARVLTMDSQGKPEEVRKLPQFDKPDIAQKTRWGDLEDGVNGVGIKFGSIGDDSLLSCRKHENIPDVIPCDSSQGEEKGLTTTTIDSEIVSQQAPSLRCEDVIFGENDSDNDVMKISLEPPKHQEMNEEKTDPEDDRSCCDNKTANDNGLDKDFLSVKNAAVVAEKEHTLIINEESDIKISDVQERNCSPSKAVNAQGTESQVAESEPEITGDSAASVEEVSSPPDGNVENIVSYSHDMSALEEGHSNESKERFRQRLWCFLFENLNRSVDELYLLCELECDLEQMKEAILVLEEAAFDFKELITRVEDFEKVKKSSQVNDGVTVTLKSDHRRPHALSWEVRRMTTSPHRADILSSSLEAFRKIQQDRGNNTENVMSKCLTSESGGKLKKSRGSDGTHNAKYSITKPGKHIGTSDANQGNLNGKKHNIEGGKPDDAVAMQNGRSPPKSMSSSEVNVSKLTPSENSASFATSKSKRDHLGSGDKMVSKKDKVATEVFNEKNPRSIYNLRRQIPLPEKDREKRNTAPGKSMNAWKEKRNWEDILSSPLRVSSRMSYSPSMSRKSAERVRTLHDKLMSPDKKKKTTSDLKKEADEKHARAMRIRSELENERVQKLQRTSQKFNRVNEWHAVRHMKLREGMHARHQRSETRHEAFLAQVVKRAGDESSKVNEVRFITSLNEENKKLILRQKLHESELRRAEKLQVIKSKQKEDLAREEAVLERRRLIEAEKLQRLAEIQRKKEEAQVRREEERKASSAAREARAIEQLRRKEERVKAQQEEAELLAQKLAERLNESEQRRKIYLEQIRERANLRDQSSPLLRRSLNKEGQGRPTLTNISDDSQTNIAPSVGSCLGIGNITLQHSIKKRIKRTRQRLMALKYEYTEPPLGGESAGIGYRVAVGAARAKVGRWLQELQRLRQARKEGATSIGLIISEMIRYLEGKDPELQASRQAGLLDFIASALPASHTSKPEACHVTLHLLKLLRVVLSTPANRSYFLAQNLLPPIIPMLSAALENYIKIAASLSTPGNFSVPSNKASVENFESISEILNNFLWIVTAILGHISSEERQLQMRDGLLELLISYQVIHRLRDLFALHDRPQMEGSAFPSPILLSIHLLVALTSRSGTISHIDWDYSPLAMEQEIGSEGANFADSAHFIVNNSMGDYSPLPIINSNSVMHLPDVPEDRPLDGIITVNRSDESIANDLESEQIDSSFKLKNDDMEKIDDQDESMKNKNVDIANSFVPHKDEKHTVTIVRAQKNEKESVLAQPVVFLLSAVSETGLVSLPSLLTAVLLQANNRSSSEQVSFILPSNFEEVAAGVLKVLNNVALLDLLFLQRMLARPDLKMEIFHLMSFLLSHCVSRWKTPNDQVGSLMLESLSLLGHFALFHPGNQAVLRWGKSPTILHKVCDLPFIFFSDPELMPIMAGTLVAACYGCEQNKFVVQQELSIDMLLSLLRSCKNAAPASQLNSTLDNSLTDESSECNQSGTEFRKPQVDSAIKYSRSNGKGTRASLGKNGALGNSIKNGRIRSLRDGKAAKNSEEATPKQNLAVPETSPLMLHSRFPQSFIDKVEQFFSMEIPNRVDTV
ncbi:putative S phase cyclin A-associated protein in the endoplasmic reticulum [Lupinus albus]|uniref:Putative S phase cyclin A-associated protein in the endoplasmic reticulum n=1 Tax=Lupinus albus TaxID=3870 RepID=A0A6A4PK82_LUPAL|nr:putative S phase cyclin A-associated protein in the endoplasmic reticulum [Lupinus albus]